MINSSATSEFAIGVLQVKETEVKELEEQNRRLQLVMEKMRDDIDLLESSSRVGTIYRWMSES